MNRRDILKSFSLIPVALVPKHFWKLANNASFMPSSDANVHTKFSSDSAYHYESKWHEYQNMPWTGEDLWAQRLQDWCIYDNELVCLASGPNRTVHVLTHQLKKGKSPVVLRAKIRFLSGGGRKRSDCAGFRLNIQGRYKDNYRSAVITGKGVDAGITGDGHLFLSKYFSDAVLTTIQMATGVDLVLKIDADGNIHLYALDGSDRVLAEVLANPGNANLWSGNIALLSSFATVTDPNVPRETVAFRNFSVDSQRLDHHPDQVFGGVYFAQYTVNQGTLKLSAQLAPIDQPGAKAQLWFKKNGQWNKIAEAPIHPAARVAAFRVTDWDARSSRDYAVRYAMPLKNGKTRMYEYRGVIAAEPDKESKVRALLYSCNWDLGFPDEEVVVNSLKHNADLAMFVGDQIYEANGGFHDEVDLIERSEMDYLRKWIQFGWSYRDIFRRMPSICLCDDHDMYQGNIWGCGGRPSVGVGSEADIQDSGGYKMSPQWVNMVQLTQTSHMPDPYDPNPILQDITVYYTHWEYGGISFGVIEDRKWKSAPKDILPSSAHVWNGYAQNPNYDVQYTKWSLAELVGQRQMKFLRHWNNSWNSNTRFKVLVSATPMACLQTLPAGSMSDNITSDLKIPDPGIYVKGDGLTRDMDTNAWPQNRRDDVLRLLRKNFTLHMTGDQHMASVIQYGVEEFGDSGFAFTSPAVGNIWPRRWWPPIDSNHEPIPGQPAYTGNFKDGFGNRMTVYAVANPRKTGRKPALLYDRPTGYCVVDFDKKSERVTMHCWPRYIDPVAQPDGEYAGWPISVDKVGHMVPKGGRVRTRSISLNPGRTHFIRVVNRDNGELVCQTNLRADCFTPPLRKAGRYIAFITDHVSGRTRQVEVLSQKVS